MNNSPEITSAFDPNAATPAALSSENQQLLKSLLTSELKLHEQLAAAIKAVEIPQQAPTARDIIATLRTQQPHAKLPDPSTWIGDEAKTEQVLREAVIDVYSQLPFVSNRDLYWQVSDGSDIAAGVMMPPHYQPNMKRGEVIPVYRSEAELRLIRDRSRIMAANNEFALCAIENRKNYVVGDGFTYTAAPCDPNSAACRAAAKEVQAIIDIWAEVNDLPSLEADAMARLDEDGEFFIRRFPDKDGIDHLRWIEPEHVTALNGDQNNPKFSFGIETDESDIETVKAYWVVESPIDNPTPDKVPESQIVHGKWNVKRTAKRGLATFYPIESNLRRCEDTLASLGHIARARAKIALIRKVTGATTGVAQSLVNNLTSIRATDPATSDHINIERFRYGTILTSGQNVEYQFPNANLGASDIIEVLQADLRACASRLQMPEWMFTALADAKYSNAFVVEAPTLKSFRRLQRELRERFGLCKYGCRRSLLWRQLVAAAKKGLISENALDMVHIQCEGPTLEARDRMQEVERHEKLVMARFESMESAQKALELDPDVEKPLIDAENVGKSRPTADMGAVLQLQGQYYAGQISRAAAHANLCIVMGFTDEQAQNLLPVNAATVLTGQPPMPAADPTQGGTAADPTQGGGDGGANPPQAPAAGGNADDESTGIPEVDAALSEATLKEQHFAKLKASSVFALIEHVWNKPGHTGFTGVVTASNGVVYHYVNGVRVHGDAYKAHSDKHGVKNIVTNPDPEQFAHLAHLVMEHFHTKDNGLKTEVATRKALDKLFNKYGGGLPEWKKLCAEFGYDPKNAKSSSGLIGHLLSNPAHFDAAKAAAAKQEEPKSEAKLDTQTPAQPSPEAAPVAPHEEAANALKGKGENVTTTDIANAWHQLQKKIEAKEVDYGEGSKFWKALGQPGKPQWDEEADAIDAVVKKLKLNAKAASKEEPKSDIQTPAQPSPSEEPKSEPAAEQPKEEDHVGNVAAALEDAAKNGTLDPKAVAKATYTLAAKDHDLADKLYAHYGLDPHEASPKQLHDAIHAKTQQPAAATPTEQPKEEPKSEPAAKESDKHKIAEYPGDNNTVAEIHKFPQQNGKYTVSLKDGDSGNVVPHSVKIVESLDKAHEIAKSYVGQKEESKSEPAPQMSDDLSNAIDGLNEYAQKGELTKTKLQNIITGNPDLVDGIFDHYGIEKSHSLDDALAAIHSKAGLQPFAMPNDATPNANVAAANAPKQIDIPDLPQGVKTVAKGLPYKDVMKHFGGYAGSSQYFGGIFKPHGGGWNKAANQWEGPGIHGHKIDPKYGVAVSHHGDAIDAAANLIQSHAGSHPGPGEAEAFLDALGAKFPGGKAMLHVAEKDILKKAGFGDAALAKGVTLHEALSNTAYQGPEPPEPDDADANGFDPYASNTAAAATPPSDVAKLAAIPAKPFDYDNFGTQFHADMKEPNQEKQLEHAVGHIKALKLAYLNESDDANKEMILKTAKLFHQTLAGKGVAYNDIVNAHKAAGYGDDQSGSGIEKHLKELDAAAKGIPAPAAAPVNGFKGTTSIAANGKPTFTPHFMTSQYSKQLNALGSDEAAALYAYYGVKDVPGGDVIDTHRELQAKHIAEHLPTAMKDADVLKLDYKNVMNKATSINDDAGRISAVAHVLTSMHKAGFTHADADDVMNQAGLNYAAFTQAQSAAMQVAAKHYGINSAAAAPSQPVAAPAAAAPAGPHPHAEVIKDMAAALKGKNKNDIAAAWQKLFSKHKKSDLVAAWQACGMSGGLPHTFSIKAKGVKAEHHKQTAAELLVALGKLNKGEVLNPSAPVPQQSPASPPAAGKVKGNLHFPPPAAKPLPAHLDVPPAGAGNYANHLDAAQKAAAIPDAAPVAPSVALGNEAGHKPKLWNPDEVESKHAEYAGKKGDEVDPTWNAHPSKDAYGGIVVRVDPVTGKHQLLLRLPAKNKQGDKPGADEVGYDGYSWTFPKGKRYDVDTGKTHPDAVTTALAEVAEETGHKGEIIGHIPGTYQSDGSTTNHFFVMKSTGEDPSLMDKESAATKWVDVDAAHSHIAKTTKTKGRERDLAILAAVKDHLKGKAATDPTVAGHVDALNVFKAEAASGQYTPEQIGVKLKYHFSGLHPHAVEAVAAAHGTTAAGLAQHVVDHVHANKFAAGVPTHQPGFNTALHNAMLINEGSTGAKHFSINGQKFSSKDGGKVKYGKEQVKNEADVNKAYNALSVNVPSTVFHDGKKISKWIDGTPLGEWEKTATPQQKAEMSAKLKKDFVSHVLFNNWDVFGMHGDNVKIDANGNPSYIDNGGVFDVSANGTKKGGTDKPFKESAVEGISNFKNPSVNKHGAKWYAGITDDEIHQQIAHAYANKDKIVKALGDSPHAQTVAKRIESLHDWAKPKNAHKVKGHNGTEIHVHMKPEVAAMVKHYGGEITSAEKAPAELSKWLNHVDKEGMQGVKDFTGSSYYTELNAALYQKKKLSSTLSGVDARLQKAFASMPELSKPVTLWHGSSDLTPEWATKMMQAGKPVSWSGYMSTCADKESAWKEKALLEIRNVTYGAMDVAASSKSGSGEQEVLTNRGNLYRVVHVGTIEHGTDYSGGKVKPKIIPHIVVEQVHHSFDGEIHEQYKPQS